MVKAHRVTEQEPKDVQDVNKINISVKRQWTSNGKSTDNLQMVVNQKEGTSLLVQDIIIVIISYLCTYILKLE